MASIQIEAAAKEIMTSASAAASRPLMAAAAGGGDTRRFLQALGGGKAGDPDATILASIDPAAAGTLTGLIKIGDRIAAGMGCT